MNADRLLLDLYKEEDEEDMGIARREDEVLSDRFQTLLSLFSFP